jgi:hypothetical protein
MSQVTIYLPPSTLDAAKAAASKAQLSVSQWFARFAQAEEQKLGHSWSEFLNQLDSTHGEHSRNGLDFMLSSERNADLRPQRELETF